MEWSGEVWLTCHRKDDSRLLVPRKVSINEQMNEWIKINEHIERMLQQGWISDCYGTYKSLKIIENIYYRHYRSTTIELYNHQYVSFWQLDNLD